MSCPMALQRRSLAALVAARDCLQRSAQPVRAPQRAARASNASRASCAGPLRPCADPDRSRTCPQATDQRLDRRPRGRTHRGRTFAVCLRARTRARRRRQHARIADRHARPLRQRLRPALPARRRCGHRLRRRPRSLQEQAGVCGRLAADQLSAEPVSLRGARFRRPEINSLQDLAGKAVNFNTPGTAANFSGPDHLQAARHRGEGDLHSPHRRHGEDAARCRGCGNLLGLVQAAGAVPEGQMAGRLQVPADRILRQARILYARLSGPFRLSRP